MLIPGNLDARTGGYCYDRRIIAGLRDRGWQVQVSPLAASFPIPTDRALADALARLQAIDADETVLIDGLALGAMPQQAHAQARRLRLVGLVHHPLADEAGLSPEQSASLRESEQAALAALRHVVVTSRATARAVEMMKVDSGKISVIEPGTDPAPLALRRGRDPLQLLAVGAVIPRKGYHYLIEALARLRGLPWQLDIIGSLTQHPATAAALQALILANGLQDRVQLAGELDDHGLARAYHRADLFVLPSLLEGYGMAFAEALARGLPILGSGAGAVSDTVPSEAGILVAAGCSAALAEALAALLQNRARLRALMRGAEQARARLPDWPSQHARWDRLLRDV